MDNFTRNYCSCFVSFNSETQWRSRLPTADLVLKIEKKKRNKASAWEMIGNGGVCAGI